MNEIEIDMDLYPSAEEADVNIDDDAMDVDDDKELILEDSNGQRPGLGERTESASSLMKRKFSLLTTSPVKLQAGSATATANTLTSSSSKPSKRPKSPPIPNGKVEAFCLECKAGKGGHLNHQHSKVHHHQ